MNDQDIFIKASAIEDPTERSKHLDDVCGNDAELRERIQRLLRHHRPDSCPLDRVAQFAARRTDSAGQPGKLIDRYKLVSLIGEGGFGEVWKSEQVEPVRRRVALKIIKLGMDTKQLIARFKSEQRVLAMMSHDNIAKLFDVGATETGRPYFVMEYVDDAVPITAYCTDQKLGIPQRLALFTEVCHAVQHAHQKGIIHRDIKPNNVLITTQDGTPVPKIIDFGISKASGQAGAVTLAITGQRHILGTPSYMSPEQADFKNEDIDTRCDVYSLGVLLYELLTGATPFDSEELHRAGDAEMLRVIREEEPKKPSTRIRNRPLVNRNTESHPPNVRQFKALVAGDLDWIVMKCLEKDRSRRYSSAKELADDVLRHLQNEPVMAGPPSAMYRAQKFVRRNRGAVLLATVSILSIAAGAVGITIGLFRAYEQRDRAQAARVLAEKTVDFQAGLLAHNNLAELGKGLVQEWADQLRYNLKKTQAQRHSETMSDFEIEGIVEEFQSQLSKIDSASAAKAIVGKYLLEPAAIRASRDFADDPALESTIRRAIARNYAALGQYAKSKEHARWAYDTLRAELPANSRAISESALILASAYFNIGRIAEAEQLIETTLDTVELGTTSRERELRVELLAAAGSIGFVKGNYEESERRLRAALEFAPKDTPNTAMLFSRIATIRHSKGDFVDAEQHLRKAIEIRSHHPDFLIDQLTDMSSLGAVLNGMERFKEAEEVLRETMPKIREQLGAEHPKMIPVSGNLGVSLLEQGQLENAEPLFKNALGMARKIHGNDYRLVPLLISNLGKLSIRAGRYDDAELYLRESVVIRKRALGESHPDYLKSLIQMAVFLHGQERLAEAEPMFRKVVSGYRRVQGPHHAETLAATNSLAEVLFQQRKFREAEPHLRAVLEGYVHALGPDHPDTLNAAITLGALLRNLQRFKESEVILLETIGRIARSSDSSEQRRTVHMSLTTLYEQWHESESHMGYDAKAAAWRARIEDQQTHEADGVSKEEMGDNR